MYSRGQGVLKNLVRAYAWINLAAEQIPKYAKYREEKATKMTPQQIASAQEFSIELQNKIEKNTKGNK